MAPKNEVFSRTSGRCTKIYVIVKNYVHRIPEGHTNIAINIVESIKANDLEPTILAIEPTTVESADLRRVRQFPMLTFRSQVPWNLAFRTRLHDAYASIKMRLAKLDCDIIHLLNVPAWVYANTLNAFKQNKCPIIAHIWYHNKLTGSIFWRQELWFLKKFCDKVIVTSRYLADHYRTSLGQKVVNVPPPIDVERYGPRETLSARKCLGLPPDEILVGYIGNPSYHRGAFDLLKAFEYVKDARLVMTFSRTSASDEITLNTYLKKLGDTVTILGTLNHPEVFYNAVDMLVLPFKRPYAVTEPPLTVLEALSSGTPLITTPVGAIKEVTSHGYNAVHIKSSFNDIGAAIQMLSGDENLRDRLRLNSRASAMQFSLENVGRKILRVYKDLLEARS